jgi:hypothetical protein
VEQTLARLPSEPQVPHRSWSSAHRDVKAEQEARAAARAQARGKSFDELRDLLAAEYSQRRVEASPYDLRVGAEMLQLEQKPFGRARSALHALRMAKTLATDGVRLIKQADDDPPDWLQAPKRASYPVQAFRHYRAVRVDPSAMEYLDRVHAEAPRRMGRTVLIDAWLTRTAQDPATLEVHIGEQTIGHVDAGNYADMLSAAELFDEDPVCEARLTLAPDAGGHLLEIAAPPSAEQP